MIVTQQQLDRLCQIGFEANGCHRRLESLSTECGVVLALSNDHPDLAEMAGRSIVHDCRDPCEVAGRVALMLAERHTQEKGVGPQ